MRSNKKINYVTNISLNETSGGWSGINFHIYQQLSKSFDLKMVGPVNPPSLFYEKFYSKLRRVMGGTGSFHFFSDKRLKKISNQVNYLVDKNNPNFFFGNTPWILNHSSQPYYLYLDAAFPTYMNVFSNIEKFIDSDIRRISKLEENWLNNASHIFWGSNWALNDAKKYYNFAHNRMTTVWVGGNIPIPEHDLYTSGINLTFISLNFAKKGGHLCVEVFKQIRKLYKDASLTIIGEKPPAEYLNIPGLVYAGLLDKNNYEDNLKMQKILSESFLLIHPTEMDTMGAVIIESGYYGCPTIATNNFGIPELIIDGETGLLLNLPLNVNSITSAVINLITNPENYLQMRKNVKKHTTSVLSWDSIGNKISSVIADDY